MAKRPAAREERGQRREPAPLLEGGNLLQWVLQRRASAAARSGAGQKSLLHRLVLVASGSPGLSDGRELPGHWERLLQSVQHYYPSEAVTGLLLLYPSCMLHTLEPLHRPREPLSLLQASSDVLFAVLRELRDAQWRRPLVADAKILVLSHNIPARLFPQWSSRALSASGPVLTGTKPLEGLVGECLGALQHLGHLQQQSESPSQLQLEQVPELLRLEAAVVQLLACSELQSPEQFLQAYDSPLHADLSADHVWPVCERLALPSAALEQSWPMGPAAPALHGDPVSSPAPSRIPEPCSTEVALRARAMQAHGHEEGVLRRSRTLTP